MEYLIYTIILLAIWHFLYESIILPTLRMKLRYQLFECRDQLVRLNTGNSIDNDVFDTLYYSINSTISRLPYITLSLVWESKVLLRDNKRLREKISKRKKMIDNCNNNNIKEIDMQAAEITLKALVANSGAWIIYTLPFILLIFIFSAIVSKVRNYLRDISLTPEVEFNQLTVNIQPC